MQLILKDASGCMPGQYSTPHATVEWAGIEYSDLRTALWAARLISLGLKVHETPRGVHPHGLHVEGHGFVLLEQYGTSKRTGRGGIPAPARRDVAQVAGLLDDPNLWVFCPKGFADTPVAPGYGTTPGRLRKPEVQAFDLQAWASNQLGHEWHAAGRALGVCPGEPVAVR